MGSRRSKPKKRIQSQRLCILVEGLRRLGVVEDIECDSLLFGLSVGNVLAVHIANDLDSLVLDEVLEGLARIGFFETSENVAFESGRVGERLAVVFLPRRTKEHSGGNTSVKRLTTVARDFLRHEDKVLTAVGFLGNVLYIASEIQHGVDSITLLGTLVERGRVDFRLRQEAFACFEVFVLHNSCD